MPATFIATAIDDVVVIHPKIFADNRGHFLEVFKASDMQEQGLPAQFCQVNQSFSERNVLRGLHYQIEPAAQGKLVRVLSGEIWDVAVDIREGSPTCGKWVAETLSAENKHMLYIPVGFAHGFCVLSHEAVVVYYCTNEYSPAHERSIIWNDPTLAITWPIENPVVSGKDEEAPLLCRAERNFTY